MQTPGTIQSESDLPDLDSLEVNEKQLYDAVDNLRNKSATTDAVLSSQGMTMSCYV